MRQFVFAAVLGVLPLAAPAQERPRNMQPTRDVAVTYRPEGAGAPGVPGDATMRMSWLAAEQKLRVDPAGGAWLLIDRREGQAVMVLDAQRMVMRLPIDGPMRELMRADPSANARFTRGASETIAGQRCTVWRIEDGASRGSTCLTDDGVMLRAEGEAEGRRGGLVATAVAYGAQDAARFRVPAGYQTMQMPGGLGGAAPPPAR